MPPKSSIHIPVLMEEVLSLLSPREGGIYVDGTLGGGGHTREIAKRVGDGGRVIALDRDAGAVEVARRELADLSVTPLHATYAKLPLVLETLGVNAVDGILLDLGLSSDQLADRSRGFSFDSDGELDLRFDQSLGEPAHELLNRIGERELADIIYQFGEERKSRRIASKVVQQRQTAPIRTAAELAALVRSCVSRGRHHTIDPATRTFQALRIAVNEELTGLETALQAIPACLKPGGRAAIISFHSLEDRRVKNGFRDDNNYVVVTKKPIVASEREMAANPRSRSAKLRVAERRSQ